MDLNKDTREIYSVDRESYTTYMRTNRKESSSFLDSIIKLLLIALLLVCSYFFYKIVEQDLSFDEVFNKQEFYSVYNLFEQNKDEPVVVKKEDYVEKLAKNVVKQEKTAVMAAYKEADKIFKEETTEVNVESAVVVEEIVLEEPTVKVVEPIVKKVEEIVVPKTAIKEEPEEAVFPESYLELMSKELNSI